MTSEEYARQWFFNAEADQHDFFCSLEMTVRREHQRADTFHQGRYPTPRVLRDDLLSNQDNQ